MKTRWKSDCEDVIAVQRMHRRWRLDVNLDRVVVTDYLVLLTQPDCGSGWIDGVVSLGGVVSTRLNGIVIFAC